MDIGTPVEGALKRILDDEGRRQNWLADRTGIHFSDVSRIVNGMDPGEAKARAIAEVLRRTPTECGWPQHEPSSQAAA